MSKSRAAPAHRAHRPKVGEKYASPTGAVRGVDPFTTLVVTAVNKDGTVNLAATGIEDDRTWENIPAAKLVRVG